MKKGLKVLDGDEPDVVMRAYARVFAGHAKANTHAAIVLRDLHASLARPSPKDSFEAAVATGRQQAYYYILDMIEVANSDG